MADETTLPPVPRDAAAYLDQAADLLPPGPFWEGFRVAGGRARKLLEPRAEALAAADARALAAVMETVPFASRETLAYREMEAGLPGPCPGAASDNIQIRRLHLQARWRRRGGQTVRHFEALATDLGYGVEVTEYRPFRCGFSQAGGAHRLGDPEMRFTWRMKVLGPRITHFRCGAAECGKDPLGFADRAEDLECAVTQMEPAHMALAFQYEE